MSLPTGSELFATELFGCCCWLEVDLRRCEPPAPLWNQIHGGLKSQSIIRFFNVVQSVESVDNEETLGVNAQRYFIQVEF